MLPYSTQSIDDQDIDSVIEVLQSSWLTTGPMVGKFESMASEYVSARHAVALCNGTAALHAAASVAGFGPGDEVIVPAITFVATANAVAYCGATPVFADVDPDTLLVDTRDVVRKISSRTRAIISVDYAGQPCDYPGLKKIATQNDFMLIADSCHSIGAKSFGRSVPQWVDMACYSFHPVKPMTTCEGGMVVTDNEELDSALRIFRNHGIATDHRQREKAGTFAYDMQSLGYNYRLSDVHCALGCSQIGKLNQWTKQRATIADTYRELLADESFARPLANMPGTSHAHHLFVVRWNERLTGVARDQVVARLRNRGIHANVHYRPVYQHSYYQRNSQRLRINRCPNAETVYQQIISLPIYPAMSQDDVKFVVHELRQIAGSATIKTQVA